MANSVEFLKAALKAVDEALSEFEGEDVTGEAKKFATLARISLTAMQVDVAAMFDVMQVKKNGG